MDKKFKRLILTGSFILVVSIVCTVIYLKPVLFSRFERYFSQEKDVAERTDVGSMKSFAGIKWKSSSETILSKFGEPSGRRTMRGKALSTDLWVLLYKNEEIYGMNGKVKFILNPNVGLVKGIFKAPVKSKRNCLEQFNQLSLEIRETYSRLQERTKKVNKIKAPFCNAILVKRAFIFRYWKDSRGGGQAVLSLGMMENEHITLFVESSYSSKYWINVKTVNEEWKGVKGDIY